MRYKIIATLHTDQEAASASTLLTSAGFIKKFSGYTANTFLQPESLVEDHFVNEKQILLYTPNLNRAHKALNILHSFNATVTESSGIIPVAKELSNPAYPLPSPKNAAGKRSSRTIS